MMLGQDNWEINLVLGYHDSEQEAARFADFHGLSATLGVTNGEPVIVVTTASGIKVYDDSQAVITEIGQARLKTLGRPLDMSNPDEAAKAQTVLMNADEYYRVRPEHMVPSLLKLADFVSRYGVGYTLDHLGWGAVRLTA